MKPVLHDRALQVLCYCVPEVKCAGVKSLMAQWQAGELLPAKKEYPVQAIPAPGRPEKPDLVRPRALKPRKLTTPEGLASLVHAVTHIEFNAINLALDAVYRFPAMPHDFYTDWLQVAMDEVYHFELLNERLKELGYQYGDFPAHNGLWEMAVLTDDDLLKRMGLVPRVFEARGLDVTPGMIQRLQSIGDQRTVDILKIIHSEEIDHVAAGNRWFNWVCEQRGLEPQAAFLELIREYLPGRIRGPFDYASRLKAGFTQDELEKLERLNA